MKILSLNIWGGRQGDLFFNYIKEYSKTTDVFVFQEVFSSPEKTAVFNNARINLFQELKDILTDFKAFFIPTYEGWVDMDKVDFKVNSGQAIFVKKSIKVLSNGSEYIFGNAKTEIHENFQNEPKTLQYVNLEFQSRNYLVINIHGLWYPGTKVDTSARLEQSKKILEFAGRFQSSKIIVGDFNLFPDTESIKMFDRDYKNLIQEYIITNTRNEVSWKNNDNIQHFADFAFVSRDVQVVSFEVPYNLVSDHLPMILQIKS